MENLDPTQRSFADLALSWASSGKSNEFFAVLLGTAGTGKTTTLQAVLERLRQQGFGRILVSDFTGVGVARGRSTICSSFRK